MNELHPFTVVRPPIDLTSCDFEPVQRIGSVQSHGVLLVFESAAGDRLESWSENWVTHFPDHDSRDATLSSLFPPDQAEALACVEASDRALVMPFTTPDGAEITAHRVGAFLLVEIENVSQAVAYEPISSMNTIMSALSRTSLSEAYLTTLASELRDALGMSRVMIYRFLPDWTGEVVAEAAAESQIYLGLRYPASDIPKPARDIFARVWVRHIADISAPTAPLAGIGEQPSSLDLTFVGVRASAPVHLEYLENMGVSASITCSLRIGGRLWGLIACHHDAAYQLRPSHRAGLEVLSQMASFGLSQMLDRETRGERQAGDNLLLALQETMEADENSDLAQRAETLAGLVESDAIAIFEDGHWNRLAAIPLQPLENFASWLRSESIESTTLYFTAQLPHDLVPDYAGALVVAPTGLRGKLVCWFRKEQSQSVRWAGQPDKTSAGSVTQRLSPRASFGEYIELTRGKSLSWTELDLWKAERFAESYRSLALRQARRLQQKNEALARSNVELDSFAYMASHDLKEPLRGIANYATFLKEDYGDKLEGEGLEYLEGLTGLAVRMTTLLDSLLSYSRLNSQGIDLVDCDLAALARSTIKLLELTRSAEVEILEPMPTVLAYPPFLSEIFINLMTNAAKYTESDGGKITIGALPENEREWTFYVKDNGIGIDPDFHDDIFHLFRRLHGEGERGGGSGVGLTIVKKMVDRHHGSIRLESAPGRGSTFFVSLPKRKHSS